MSIELVVANVEGKARMRAVFVVYIDGIESALAGSPLDLPVALLFDVLVSLRMSIVIDGAVEAE